MIYDIVQKLTGASAGHHAAQSARIPMTSAVRKLRRTRRVFRRFFLVSLAVFAISAALVIVGGRAESTPPTTMALVTAIAFVAFLASGTSLVGFITATAQIWRHSRRESKQTEAAGHGERDLNTESLEANAEVPAAENERRGQVSE